jgi:hypothetical protein
MPCLKGATSGLMHSSKELRSFGLQDAFKMGMEDPTFTAVLAQLDEEAYYSDSQDYHACAMQERVWKCRVEELGLKQD